MHIGNNKKGVVVLRISKKAPHRLADEVARMEASDTDKSKHGCLSRSTFGLSCPCSLAKTIKKGKLICLFKTHSHWKS
jgi:hypothetical protein